MPVLIFYKPLREPDEGEERKRVAGSTRRGETPWTRIFEVMSRFTS